MNLKTVIESLYYISNKLNKPIDKLIALKLIFFADRYHLRKYGRFITDDTYYAMRLGPVPSAAKEILSFDPDDSKERKFISEYITKTGKHSYKTVNKKARLDRLSETDKEALDFSINTFGKYKNTELVKITHKYPEWLRYKSSFESEQDKRELIVIEDFFNTSDIEDDPFNIIPQETVDLSKQFFLGLFE